jgi:hypothetical protein
MLQFGLTERLRSRCDDFIAREPRVTYERLKGLLIQEDRVYFRTRPAEYARQKTVKFISPLLPLTLGSAAVDTTVNVAAATEKGGGWKEI